MHFTAPRWRAWLASGLIVSLGLAVAGCTGGGNQTGPWDQRPGDFQVNRLPATARTIPLADAAAAAAADEDSSPWLASLNGPWSFTWSPSLSQAPSAFMDPERSVADWDQVEVPHTWQIDGYGDEATGDLVYLNERHPWQGYETIEPPAIPTQGASIGSYRRNFNVPAQWQDRRIVLGFQGVKSAFTVWVNGQEIGYSEDSFTPAEFDVTDAVVEGENVVAVQVHRWSDGSWLENQDMIDLSGIFRDVEVYALPGTWVDDHQVSTEIGDDFSTAQVSAVIDVARDDDGAAATRLIATLLDASGNEVGRDETELSLADSQAQSLTVAIDVDQPELWSVENPYLYTLVYELTDGPDSVEFVSTRVGIREFGIVEGQMMINGSPLRINGMNRGEMHPDVGQALTAEIQRADLIAMRRSGVTAMRTAHYPADPDLYRLADEIGMYIMDEANVESHALRPFPGNSPEWDDAVLDRVSSMFERDKNHASVLWWSLGNEAGPGPVFAEAADWLRAQDPTRLVHYQDDSSVADIDGVFYPLNDQLVERAAQTTGRPWIATEYQHAMGNSLGGIAEDWAVIESNPELQGGFVWDWADQAIRLPIEGGVAALPIPDDLPEDETFFSYGGDWGDYATDGGFELNGVVLPDRRPQPELADLAAVYEPVQLLDVSDDGTAIQVRNEYLFTDLADLAISWRAEVDGVAAASGDAAAQLGPLQTGWLELTGLAALDVPTGAVATVTVEFALAEATTWAEAGQVVATLQFRPGWAGDAAAPPLATGQGKVEVESSAGTLRLSASNVSISLDAASGAITSIVMAGSEVLAAPIRPDFWRAPTQNDTMNGLVGSHRWRTASQGMAAAADDDGGIAIDSVEVTTGEDGSALMTAQGWIRMDEEPGFQLRVRLLPSGDIVVESTLAASQVRGEIPAVGLAVDLDGDLDTLTWLGNGPHESWRDRQAGARFGRWSSPVADQAFWHVVPQATGNHTGVKWATLTRDDGSGLLISAIEDPLEVAALPASEEAISQAAHPHEIVTDDVVHLAVDGVQQGLGVTWGATALEQFSVSPADEHTLRMVLSPVAPGEDPAERARRAWVEP
ncbi:MAG: glycoside hydrolase family 2 TIM barrel-domain containing protein [Arachnia sp.]